MQPRGRLVQNIQGFSRAAPCQLAGQLHTLCFTAGQLGRRLSQFDIAKAHFFQGFQMTVNGRNIPEELQRLTDAHIQYIENALILIFHFQSFPVVPASLADLARNIDIRQEMHLDLDNPVAAAGFAPAAFYIEAEAPLLIAPQLGFRKARKQIPDKGKHAGIGRRVGTGCSADR